MTFADTGRVEKRKKRARASAPALRLTNSYGSAGERVRFAGQRRDRGGDLMNISPYVGGGAAHITATVIVTGERPGHRVAEVALHPGQDGVPDPMGTDLLHRHPRQRPAQPHPQPVVAAVRDRAAVTIPQ